MRRRATGLHRQREHDLKRVITITNLLNADLVSDSTIINRQQLLKLFMPDIAYPVKDPLIECPVVAD